MKQSFELIVRNVANGLTIVARIDGKAQTLVAKDATEAKALIAEQVEAALADQPQSKPAVTKP